MIRTKYFDPSFPLTPSELFFFDVQGVDLDHPMTYERGNWKKPLPQYPRQDPEYLLILTALLANTQIGSLKMEVNIKRTLLGLGVRQTASVSRVKEPGTWTVDSLESDLFRIAASIDIGGRCQISDLVDEWLNRLNKNATWFERQEGRPHKRAVEFVRELLCKRGHINKLEKQTFLGVSYFDYYPQGETLQTINEGRVELIKEMLSDFTNSQPELSEVVLKDIRDVFRRHRTWQ